MTEHQEPPPKPRWSTWRIVALCYRLLRNTVFVVWLIFALVSLSLAASAWAAYATWKATQLTYRVAEMAVQRRKSVARAIAKARLRRLASAIPFVGTGAALYFERQSYAKWRQLYPEGTPNDYACDMATLTAEVVDEVFQELPATIRPPAHRFVPDCKTP